MKFINIGNFKNAQEELKNEVEDPTDSEYEEESEFEDSLDNLEFDESDLDKEEM